MDAACFRHIHPLRQIVPPCILSGVGRHLSHLSLTQVYAALTYYHANHDEIEANSAEEEAEYSRLAALHGQNAEQV